MTRRPRVLVAISPLLLADLLRAALPPHFDVVVWSRAPRSWRRWDVAIVPPGGTASVPRARHVVTLPMHRAEDGRSTTSVRDFRALVALVQRLCEVRPSG